MSPDELYVTTVKYEFGHHQMNYMSQPDELYVTR